MINVSNEFWKLMHERTDFKENAEITFQDGTVLELDESLFTTDNNSVTDAAGVNSIPLGVALSRSIQIELQNDDERFSTYDFFGATIRLYLTFQLSETVEKIEYGTFTVVSPATYGETVIITANDDMWKTDVAYNTNLSFPAQAWEVLQDSCVTCGISLSTIEFLNNDFEIQEKPSSDYTHKQIIGYIAMIACGNARINLQGYLEILSYDFSFLNEITDGGTFNPWTGGYVADGGTFNPWTEGDVLDGGLFTDRKDYHILYNFKDSPRVDTDDVVITGVQTTIQPTDSETHTVLLGQEGYVLEIENPLITGNEENALQRIGAVMLNGRMRKFEGDHIAYPIAEFMDKAFVVDRKGNIYGTILTDVNFVFFGYTTFKNSAENAVRNASKFQSQGTQAIIKAQQLVKQEKTARELAEQNLTKALVESSGLYFTKEKQEDGSEICYGHNKPTLEESDTIWKFTAGAVGVSTDGGETYAYGFTVTGELLANVLTVYGVNADWIKVGVMLADRIKGGTLTLGGSDNKDGIAVVLDASGNEVVRLSKDGVDAKRGSFNGNVSTNKLLVENGYMDVYGTHTSPSGAESARISIRPTSSPSLNTSWWDYAGLIFKTSELSGSPSVELLASRDLIFWTSPNKAAWGTWLDETGVWSQSLTISGTKSRQAKTENYGDRLLYCYEMPSPIFGDIGHGVTGEDGLCYIDVDQIFFETVDMNQSYQVFLQSYSEHNVYVLEKQQQYFVVKGQPNTEFDWELKAKQLDFPIERLEEKFAKDDYEETDYVALASAYLSEYEQEVLNYE